MYKYSCKNGHLKYLSSCVIVPLSCEMCGSELASLNPSALLHIGIAFLRLAKFSQSQKLRKTLSRFRTAMKVITAESIGQYCLPIGQWKVPLLCSRAKVI